MKKNINHYFIGLTICFCQLISYGQQNKIDSLFTLIKSDKADTNKVNNFIALFNQFRMIGNNDTALYFGNSALALAEKFNFEKGIAKASGNIGILYGSQGDSKAFDCFFRALEINEGLGDKSGVSVALTHIGNVYLTQGDYPNALSYFFKALKVNEELGDKKGIARNFNSIGVVFIRQGDQIKALDYFLKL